jgi:hypothetical protein
MYYRWIRVDLLYSCCGSVQSKHNRVRQGNLTVSNLVLFKNSQHSLPGFITVRLAFLSAKNRELTNNLSHTFVSPSKQQEFCLKSFLMSCLSNELLQVIVIG